MPNQNLPKELEECVFCEIVKRTGENFVIITPLKPVVEGHLLVIPKEHVTDFAESERVSAYTMIEAAKYAKEKGGDWNLITSKGSNATQTVFHLHIHLVPRRENDSLMLPWSSSENTYTAGYKEGILWVMEMMPDRLPNPYEDTMAIGVFEHGADAYRSELLSRLEERMKTL